MAYRKLVKALTQAEFQSKMGNWVRMAKGQTRRIDFDSIERFTSLLKLGIVKEVESEPVPEEKGIRLTEIDLSSRVPISQGSPK